MFADHITDLKAIASDGSEEEHLNWKSDMATINEVAKPASRGGQPSKSEKPAKLVELEPDDTSEESDGEDFEYDLEPGLVADAKAILSDWKAQLAEQDACAARLDPVGAKAEEAAAEEATVAQEAASSTAASSSSSSAPDWLAKFAQYIKKAGQYYSVVDDDGNKIGQIQPMAGMFGYKAAAVCKIKKHKGRCARLRAWRMTTEHPDRTDWALAWWLHQGLHVESTEDHMLVKRV